jgi:hypothetical protein
LKKQKVPEIARKLIRKFSILILTPHPLKISAGGDGGLSFFLHKYGGHGSTLEYHLEEFLEA